jgi:uncharacterized membrane protein YoaK (UPF0700 family)
MIDMRYIKFLLLAAVACSLFTLWLWTRGVLIDISVVIISFVLGAIFTSLITVRLPIFKQYYQPASLEDAQKYRGHANEKAALVLASLVAGVIIGSLLYACGVRSITAPIFISGICAGVISQYHRKEHCA